MASAKFVRGFLVGCVSAMRPALGSDVPRVKRVWELWGHFVFR